MKAAGETALSSEEQQLKFAGNGQRPSLGGMPGSKDDQLSILASVEGNARNAAAPVKRRHWSWLMSAALAVTAIGCVAWLMPFGVPPAAVASSIADGSTTPAQPSTEAVAAPASTTVPASSREDGAAFAVHQPARIETVASSEAAAPTATDHPFVKLNDSAVPVQAMAALPAAPVSRLADSAASIAESRTAAKAPGSGPKKRATPQRERTAKRDSPASGDADVDLLAALMAHVSGNEATAAGRPAARTRVAHSAPTIAELVKSCSAMTATAARHCRQRICEGYWGKAEACPVKARPDR